MPKLVASILLAVSLGAVCYGQTPFQGLTAGSSTRADVERVLGKPVRAINASTSEYKPPAGIAKVEVVYTGSGSVERVRVYFIKPITRTALLHKFNLPDKPDAKTINVDGKVEELFGGQAMLVMLYESRDTASGIGRLVYCSRALFENTVAAIRKGNAPSLTGRWKGSWQNNKGDKGESTINLVEEANGIVTGDSSGAQIKNGRRIGNVLTWDVPGVQGCRDYKVQMKLSDDGRTLSGMYEVTNRCENKTYTGTYDNYVRR